MISVQNLTIIAISSLFIIGLFCLFLNWRTRRKNKKLKEKYDPKDDLSRKYVDGVLQSGFIPKFKEDLKGGIIKDEKKFIFKAKEGDARTSEEDRVREELRSIREEIRRERDPERKYDTRTSDAEFSRDPAEHRNLSLLQIKQPSKPNRNSKINWSSS